MNTVHHSLLAVAVAGTACFFTACQNPAGTGEGEDPPLTPNQLYLGSASVGDFRLLTADRSTRIISDQNITTGQTASLPYLVAGDESYSVRNPQGQLVDAWEVPGVTLLGTSTLSNPPLGEPSLVTALPGAAITRDTLKRGAYNVLHLRTRLGGFEAGCLEVDPGANIIHQTFSPYRLHNQDQATLPAFQTPATWNSSNMVAAASGNALSMRFNPADRFSRYCYIFQSSNLVILDTPEGSMICAPQTEAAALDPTKLGTYNGVVYRKTGATMTNPTSTTGTESPAATVAKCTVAISGAGHIRVQLNGANLVDSDFAPIATDNALTGADGSGLLESPCNGMFSDHGADPATGLTHYLFVTFSGKLVVFGYYSYTTAAVAASGLSKPYDYCYGTAMKWSDTVAPMAPN